MRKVKIIKIAVCILTIVIFRMITPSFVFALVFSHDTIKIPPKSTNQNISLTANGARYRFIVEIEVDHVDGGFVYAKDGYKYQQSEIKWSISPQESGFTTVDEGPCAENHYLTSARWQTPTNDKTYKIMVTGKRWPYGPGGGPGPYDPNWSSDRDASLQRPEIYDVYVKVGTKEYRENSEVAVEPGSGPFLVEGKARDGLGQIQYGEVEIFWKVKNDPDTDGYQGTVSPTSSKTDGTFMAKTDLTIASNLGSSHIVTGQSRQDYEPGSSDSGEIIVGCKVEITEINPSPYCAGDGNMTVKYTIKPITDFTPHTAKIEIFSEVEEVVYKKLDISHTAGDNTVTWNGKYNQGPNSGEYVNPGIYDIWIFVQAKESGPSAYDSEEVLLKKLEIKLTKIGDVTFSDHAAADFWSEDTNIKIEIIRPEGIAGAGEVANYNDSIDVFDDPDGVFTGFPRHDLPAINIVNGTLDMIVKAINNPTVKGGRGKPVKITAERKGLKTGKIDVKTWVDQDNNGIIDWFEAERDHILAVHCTDPEVAAGIACINGVITDDETAKGVTGTTGRNRDVRCNPDEVGSEGVFMRTIWHESRHCWQWMQCNIYGDTDKWAKIIPRPDGLPNGVSRPSGLDIWDDRSNKGPKNEKPEGCDPMIYDNKPIIKETWYGKNLPFYLYLREEDAYQIGIP